MSGAPVLQVEDVRAHFKVRRTRGFGRDILKAVDGVSFALARGETLGIVGESGCGKSTLGRTLLGLVPLAGGRMMLNGRDLAGLGARGRRAGRRELQVVFQDPYASLDPRMRVHDIVAEPLAINRIDRPGRVAELLSAVGLDPAAAEARRPSEFSGGQRQRIAIARALALDPDVVILDEAVSALDVSIQAQVINLLKSLQRERGLSYLFISHNLAVVRHIAHRVAVMYLGRIVEIADRDRLFGSPRHPYTQALLSAVPVADPKQRNQKRRIILEGDLPDPLAPPSGCPFRTRCFKAAARCAEAVPPLSDQGGDGHLAACFFPGPERQAAPATTNVQTS